MAEGYRYWPAAPILLYHRFDQEAASTPWTIVTSVFADHLGWLKDNSYTVAPLRDLVSATSSNGSPLAAKSVAITADDGDLTVYTDMFPLLKKYAVPATLFVNPFSISRSPGTVTWEHLAEMLETGLVDVQFHTLSHSDFEFERKRRSPTDFRTLVDFELQHSRDWIEQRLRVKVDMLAWPYGYYDRDTEVAAANAGYIAAFAVTKRAPEDDSLFSIPRATVFNRHRAGERFRALLDEWAPPQSARPRPAEPDVSEILQALRNKKNPFMKFI